MDDPDLDTAAAGLAFVYVEFGVAHGLSREALMRTAGLDKRARAGPDARVPMAAYLISRRPEVVALRFPIEVMLGIGYRLMCHVQARLCQSGTERTGR